MVRRSQKLSTPLHYTRKNSIKMMIHHLPCILRIKRAINILLTSSWVSRESITCHRKRNPLSLIVSEIIFKSAKIETPCIQRECYWRKLNKTNWNWYRLQSLWEYRKKMWAISLMNKWKTNSLNWGHFGELRQRNVMKNNLENYIE